MSSVKENANKRDEKVTLFLANHRQIFAGLIIALIAGLIIFAAVDTISRRNNEKAFMRIISISEDLGKADASDEASVAAAESKAISDLKTLAGRSHGFPAAKAYMLAAEIEFSNKQWADAASSYEAAYNSSPKSYTAPICLYNAAVAVEESGDIEKAADLYMQCSKLPDFPLASKVLFSCARIAEQQGSFENASALYQQIADEYPLSDWATLAKSRLIALKIGA